ncbi:hypothetical protein D9757_006760 [Collybiopsis confluens]|uniref:Uncharacterized protein n=1 Tax=Collybiopsis confluens TaxID=2823264 RepID=A0A8H5HM46_9AGAR|nr:hypothetical protein D9757_006760 [Collybiopsis confluens]
MRPKGVLTFIGSDERFNNEQMSLPLPWLKREGLFGRGFSAQPQKNTSALSFPPFPRRPK